MNPFDLKGKTAVVIGGGGVLGSAMALSLGKAGASVGLVVRKNAAQAVEKLKAGGVSAKAYTADAMDRASLEQCRQAVQADFKSVDILLSCVGGNQKEA